MQANDRGLMQVARTELERAAYAAARFSAVATQRRRAGSLGLMLNQGATLTVGKLRPTSRIRAAIRIEGRGPRESPISARQH